ncbi:hypothetical protein CYLTODRAFT_244517 [Cylindrobasidium torrendii FP15055 ss-10]|uniref:ARID domain-containing protein n=1 Tax=Cylindrobasidium torrendii FP15055 ss-10 TaxID=1314674 RepID=A0A0D7BG52_9AGAR|nr:hypothetical protein CYLTODRAFT_244517 [Cylindrobasidium torrendii FP15055 ss-10]
MAERHNQFPMMNNFNPALGQVSMPGQGQQGGLQDGHQGMAFNNNNESGQMWSQMQQLQAPFRPNGADHMSNGQFTQQQMATMLQSQVMANRQQGQFPLGASQIGGPSGQLPFGAGQNQLNFPGTRAAMMQAFAHNNRQLNLIDMAGNQQNQHTPAGFPNRPTQQTGQPQGGNNIFGAGANMMRNNSPPHPAMPTTPASGGSATAGPQQVLNLIRTLNVPADVHAKGAQIVAQIAATETNARNLHNNRHATGMTDGVFIQQAKMYNAEIGKGKEMMSRLFQHAQTLHKQRDALVQQQQQQQNHQTSPGQGISAGMGQANGQNNWMPQGGQTLPPTFGSPQSLPRTMPGQQGMPLNHSISTPQQFPQGGNPGSANPGQGVNTTPIPPLDKERFEKAFESFHKSRGNPRDTRSFALEGRPVDLYNLHKSVLREGGFASVSARELWPIIGGRLGFVQFPAKDGDACGPATALGLEQIYKDYFVAFDAAYVSSLTETRRKMAAQLQLNGAPPNRPGQPNAQQMQVIMGLLDRSVEELRAQKIPEYMIGFIEANRPHLMRTRAEQSTFRGAVRDGRPQPPGQQGARPYSPPNANPIGGPTLSSSPSFPQPSLPNAANGGPSSATPATMIQQQRSMMMSLFMRSNSDRLNHAQATLQSMKNEFVSLRLSTLPPIEPPPLEQRADYGRLAEQLFKVIEDLDGKLAFMTIVSKEPDITGFARKVAIIIVTLRHQQRLLSGPSPQYIVTMENLRHMFVEIQRAQEHLARGVQGMFISMASNPAYAQQIATMSGSLPNPAHFQMATRPPPAVATPSAASAHSPPIPPSSTTPAAPGPAGIKRKASTAASPPAVTPAAPTPSAAPPTPAANATSPKSPKARPKPRQATNKRRSSTTTKPTPTLEPAPSPSGSLKRPREEDSQPGPSGASEPVMVASEPSPPKKLKTDWEGSSNEGLKQREEVAVKAETEEEVVNYFEKMTQLIKLAGDKDELGTVVDDAFENLIKNYSGGPEGASMSHSRGEPSTQTASAPVPDDSGDDFFDFSQFDPVPAGEEDEPAPTPDLVSSSSTNPSPESGSEADAGQHAFTFLDFKQDETHDPLHLGTMKEVDGGEATYYHSSQWKWDDPMPVPEPTWAMSNY